MGTPPQRFDNPCSVLELRQYTLHPGRREALIDLFDRELVETQEAVGMQVIGQFRDLDAPDRFVWLRGFRDMESRRQALQAFYGGPVWQAHREAANATMQDWSDVRLLRPAEPGSGFAAPRAARPPPGSGTGVDRASLFVATIYDLELAADAAFRRLFEDRAAPALSEAGAAPLARFETETAESTFPALPIRTGENAFVWFASFASEEQHREHLARLVASRPWNDLVLPQLSKRFRRPPQILRLTPTARSQLR